MSLVRIGLKYDTSNQGCRSPDSPRVLPRPGLTTQQIRWGGTYFQSSCTASATFRTRLPLRTTTGHGSFGRSGTLCYGGYCCRGPLVKEDASEFTSPKSKYSWNIKAAEEGVFHRCFLCTSLALGFNCGLHNIFKSKGGAYHGHIACTLGGFHGSLFLVWDV